MAQMLSLLGKDFKITLINRLKDRVGKNMGTA